MLSKYEIKKLICKRQVKLFSLSPIFKFRTVRKVQYGEVTKCNIWTLNLKTHFVRHQTSTNIWAPYIYNDVVSDSTCKWRDWGPSLSEWREEVAGVLGASGGAQYLVSLRPYNTVSLSPATAGVLGLPGANRSEFECNVSLHSFPLGPGKVSVLMAQVWIDT